MAFRALSIFFRISAPSAFQMYLFGARFRSARYALIAAVSSATPAKLSSRIAFRPGTAPEVYGILQEFKRLTGYGILVNTSFNVRSEPIVCTPDDAYRCFMRTGIDTLVLEDFVLEKSEQPPWNEQEDWRKEFGLD